MSRHFLIAWNEIKRIETLRAARKLFCHLVYLCAHLVINLISQRAPVLAARLNTLRCFLVPPFSLPTCSSLTWDKQSPITVKKHSLCQNKGKLLDVVSFSLSYKRSASKCQDQLIRILHSNCPRQQSQSKKVQDPLNYTQRSNHGHASLALKAIDQNFMPNFYFIFKNENRFSIKVTVSTFFQLFYVDSIIGAAFSSLFNSLDPWSRCPRMQFCFLFKNKCLLLCWNYFKFLN